MFLRTTAPPDRRDVGSPSARAPAQPASYSLRFYRLKKFRFPLQDEREQLSAFRRLKKEVLKSFGPTKRFWLVILMRNLSRRGTS